MQVLVRLRVIETHLSLFSGRKVVQIDHLQMGMKLGSRSEIDAIFLALEEMDSGGLREVIVCCEAKGRRDDLLEDQLLSQIRAVFSMGEVVQEVVIPMGIKVVGPSEVYVAEFDEVARAAAPAMTSLSVVSEAVYKLVPPVPGIG